MKLPLCIYGQDIKSDLRRFYDEVRKLTEKQIDGHNLKPTLFGDGLELVDGSSTTAPTLINTLTSSSSSQTGGGGSYFRKKTSSGRNVGMEVIVDSTNTLGSFCVCDAADPDTQLIRLIPVTGGAGKVTTPEGALTIESAAALTTESTTATNINSDLATNITAGTSVTIDAVNDITIDSAADTIIKRNGTTGFTFTSAKSTTPFQIESTLATGTSPFAVASTTKVSNLNVDQLDSRDESEFALLAGRSGGQTLNGGTASGDDAIINSTTNATKGTISLDGRVIVAPRKTLTDAVSTQVFSIPLASPSGISGSVKMMVTVADETNNVQTYGQEVFFSAVKDGSGEYTDDQPEGVVTLVPSGTLSVTYSLSISSSVFYFSVTADTDLTPSLIYLYMTITNNSNQTVTLL